MGSMNSNAKYKHFEFDESVDEEISRWRFAQSKKKKPPPSGVYSEVDKYTFLESLPAGIGKETASKGKKLRNRTIIVHEVDEVVNERINQSDTALQSSSSNYNLKALSQSRCPDHSASHNVAIGRKASDCGQPLHVADNGLVSILSDEEDIDNSSTMSCNDLADAEGERVLEQEINSNDMADAEGERVLEQEINSNDMERSVVVDLECVAFRRSRYSKAQLTFFCSSIKLVVLEEEATGCLTFEWKTQNLISIESRWLEPLIKAEVCLLIKSNHGQKSGIVELKCIVTDSSWSKKQDLIKSLDEQYKEKWDGDLDSYELFEDVTYLEGDGDCIAIYKRDFELLQPERFINDTIVDFYIEYLKKIKPAAARVHFFNSFFFSKLADIDENQSRSFDPKEAFQRVRKWTKKVNIFEKDYIFIPVNFRLHWSLIIICHPGEAVNFTDDELELSPKVPCILHLDSIKGSHRGLENCIKGYLWEEWKERRNDASEVISSKFMDMMFLRLEVPQQENSFDCGLFMLHYMEVFVKQASDSFSPLNSPIDKDWFYPIEASLKRARIKRLIFELTKSNIRQVSSPKSSPYGLKDEDEDEEEEEADVQILHETCNPKETCDERISGTCVSKSSNVTASVEEPLRTERMDIHLSGSADIEQLNHGQMVLYNSSSNDVSPLKKSDETEDLSDKQLVTVLEASKMDPSSTCISKSMDLLQLKEKPSRDDIVIESHVVEDSEDDNDVRETCVVDDSASDGDSVELFECGVSRTHQKASSKRSLRAPEVSVAQKRLRSKS